MAEIRIGSCQILDEVSQNWFGRSYKAFDWNQNRHVLLTQCDPDWVDDEVLQRLQSEAKTFALLKHPNIVRVLGFIRRRERLYLLTEFVEGPTLQQILAERGRMPLEMALCLFREIVAGAAAAHRLAVIHGDLGPWNILVPDRGSVKIANFALGHIFGYARPIPPTREYLAPELIEGKTYDARADIHSLGVMLYYAIAGQGPFDVYDVRNRDRNTFIPVPPSLVIPEIPSWLDNLLSQMLAPDPANRPSAAAVLRLLEAGPASLAKKLGRHRAGIAPASQARVSAQRALHAFSDGRRVLHDSALFPSRLLARIEKASIEHTRCLLDQGIKRANASRNYFVSRSKWCVETMPWRKGLQATVLFVFIAAEAFYFRGAHISLLLDAATPSRRSLSDSVDDMFARIHRNPATSINNGAFVDNARGSTPTAKTESPGATERTTASAAIADGRTRRGLSTTAKQESQPINGEVDAGVKVAPVQIATAREPDLSEPARIGQSEARPRLNVQWEN
jgi:serine/threonine protein kinase